MRCLLVLLLLAAASCYDYYLVRHGARAPLSGDDAQLVRVFGAAKEQLTAPGKSQAFYYGQEIKHRHKDIADDDLKVYSTPTSRTRMTAQYFLKGWNYLLPQALSATEKTVLFNANPMWVPPIALHYTPKALVMNVSETEYIDVVEPVPVSRSHLQIGPSHSLTMEDGSSARYDPLKSIDKLSVANMKDICRRVHDSFPGVCDTDYFGLLKAHNLFGLSDLENCLGYLNKSIPDLTKQEIDVAKKAMDVNYAHRFSARIYRDPVLSNFFTLMLKHYVEKQAKLVVQFNHDVFIFMVIRALLGWDAFVDMFQPHLVMPFMSTLHFRIHDNLLSISFNDQALKIPGCSPSCTVEAFTNLLSRLP